MRTITPFKQLVSTEMERLSTVVAPRVITTQSLMAYAMSGSRYTMSSTKGRHARKGFLARVFGN